MYELTYEFFGRCVRVSTDSREVAEALDAVYARQRAADADESRGTDIAIGAWRGSGGRAPDALTSSWPGPHLSVGGRTVRVEDEEQLAHYAHLVVINAAASLVDDAVVLHSGAVVIGGRGALLLGHSGSGKTTLTVELARRGWGFLSDDFAVVRGDGVVEPFPRRINHTEHSMRLLGLTPPAGAMRLAGHAGVDKWMIDVEELFPGAIATASTLGAVALLDEPPAPAPGTASGGSTAPSAAPSGGSPVSQGSPRGRAPEREAVWRIRLDHVPAGFVPELRRMAGVQDVGRTGAKQVVLEVQVEPGAPFVQGLDDICTRFDVTVLAAERSNPWPASRPPPSIRDELLAHALCVSGARFLGQPAPSELLRALAVLQPLLRRPDLRAARIPPGDLGARADAVEALAGVRR